MLALGGATTAYALFPYAAHIEKYASDGSRLWSKSTSVWDAYQFVIAPDGRILSCSSKGFHVRNKGGVVVRSVDIKGKGGASDIELAPNGLVYLTDQDAHRVLVYSQTGRYIRTIGHKGTTRGHLKEPRLVSCDASSNVFVVDSTARIQKFSSKGVFKSSFGGKGTSAGRFPRYPLGMTIDSNGDVLTCEEPTDIEGNDPSPSRTQRFSNSGAYISSLPVGGWSIDSDASGNLWLASFDGVRTFTPSGILLTTYEGGQGEDGAGGVPWSVVVDAAGDFFVFAGAGD
jgi:hypothetical protein